MAPVSANVIYRDVSSPHREIHWFERSGHEMGQDLEADAVFSKVMEFVLKFKEPGRQEPSGAGDGRSEPG